MEFTKFYGAVLLVAAPCAVFGTTTSPVPRAVAVGVALAILGVAIRHNRKNRSLV
jgi:hypothetical protein